MDYRHRKERDAVRLLRDLSGGSLQQRNLWIEHTIAPSLLTQRLTGMHFSGIDHHNTALRRDMRLFAIFEAFAPLIDDANCVALVDMRRESVSGKGSAQQLKIAQRRIAPERHLLPRRASLQVIMPVGSNKIARHILRRHLLMMW